MRFSLLILFIALFSNVLAQPFTVTGEVKDVVTKMPLPFCVVSIYGTSKGVYTNNSGYFSILLEPPLEGRKLIITCLGFTPDTLPLDVKRSNYLVNLYPTSSHLNTVVITGTSKATLIRQNPLPVIAISSKQLEGSTESNVIDAVSRNAPGVNSVKTGPNISKPFINGLGYNRVLTLFDGMRVENQQWGDEHGLPVDDYAVDRVEVIKGPASLMYGSDAIAGVLSLFPVVSSDTDKVVHGQYLSEYHTNNKMVGNALRLAYGQRKWNTGISGSFKQASNYRSPVDGWVYNTNFAVRNLSAYYNFKTRRGYSRVNASFYSCNQGVPDGSRDSLTRRFTYQLYESEGQNAFATFTDNIKNRPVCSQEMLNTYRPAQIYQSIYHTRVYTDNYYQVGNGSLKVFAGAEQNVRKEFNHPTRPSLPAMSVSLTTLHYSVRYDFPVYKDVELSAGANGMHQLNVNGRATGAAVPDYNLWDVGAYCFFKYKHKDWTMAGGIRQDGRFIQSASTYVFVTDDGFSQLIKYCADGIKCEQQFKSFKQNFAGTSGSIGLTRIFSRNWSFKFNVAKGYRAPNISEMASNGLDPGARIYYLGNLNFKPEFSWQQDFGITGQFKSFSLDLSLFNNWVRHFIYQAVMTDASGKPVVIVPGNRTFQYQQTEALLYGFNGGFRFAPERLAGFEWINSVSVVLGKNKNAVYKGSGVNGEYLPFIPPPRLISVVSHSFNSNIKGLSLISFRLECDANALQNHYLGLDNTETATPGYILFNTGTQLNLCHRFKMFVSLNNVFNKSYQQHLSRLKYLEYYSASPSGKSGIFNMGRNLAIKVIFNF